MNERTRLMVLTRMALLNGVVLTLLSLQFVSPPAFFLLLWIAPAVFGIEASLTPLPLTLVSSLLIVVIAGGLFGLAIGVSAALFVLVGMVAGTTRRWRWIGIARVGASMLALIGGFSGFAAAAFWLANVNLTSLLATIQAGLGSTDLTTFLVTLGGGFVFLMLCVAVAIEGLIGRISRRLITHVP